MKRGVFLLAMPVLFLLAGGARAPAAKQISQEVKDQKALKALVSRDDGEGVKVWLARGREPTPGILLDAAGRGKLKALEAFLAGGVDVNAGFDLFRPAMKLTLLGTAAEKGRIEAVKLLLAAGANPGLPHMGRSLAIIAAEKGDATLLALFAEKAGLLERPDAMGWTPLHHAVLKRREKAIRFLLDQGVDRNPGDQQGMTPLHWAAQKGDVKMVSLLLEGGADTGARSKGGVTALMAAAQAGSGKAVEALLAAGADPAARSDNGMEAMDYARGIDAVTTALRAAAAHAETASEAELAEDGKVYPAGTVLSGPCVHTGAIPAEAGCGTSGTEVMIYTTLRTAGASYSISPPLCQPVTVSLEGQYSVLVHKIVTPWRGSNCYELKTTQGGAKQLVYFKKEPKLTTSEFGFEVAADTSQPPPAEKKPPRVKIVEPGKSSQFAFDDSPEGVLKFEAVAEVAGDISPGEVIWKLTPVGDAKITVTPERGGRVTITLTGLPEWNAQFGSKTLTATAGGSNDSVEIEIFYSPLAKNHPHADGAIPRHRGTPNWFYYWGNSSAGQGFAPWYVPDLKPCGKEGQSQGRYNYDLDRIEIGPEVAFQACMPRTLTGKSSRGIDCFAEVLRHEAVHRRELRAWWGDVGTSPPGCEPSANNAYKRFAGIDSDLDMVPDLIEKRLASRGCDPGSRTSCLGRVRADLWDVEMDAYTEGWKAWTPGAADREDWAKCSRQWRDKGTCR